MASPTVTDYGAHDREYAKRRGRGLPGWNSDEELREVTAELEETLASPHVPRGGRALEIGCGAGDTALLLAAHGFATAGIDVSPVAIAWAREKAAAAGLPLDLQVGDVCALDRVEPTSFDLVLDGHCLHCIIGPDRQRVLRGARRLLRPGGTFVMRTMCGVPIEPRMQALFDADTRCIVVDGISQRYLGEPDWILDELGLAGFDVLAHDLARPGTGAVEGYLRVWARRTGAGDARSLPTAAPDPRNADNVSAYERIARVYAGPDASEEDPAMRAWCRDAFASRLRGTRVLEVGCGPGTDAQRLAERGLEVTATDASEAFLEIVRERYPALRARRMDMTEPDLPPCSFDGIYGMASFIHLPRALADATLRGFRALLRSDGLLFLVLLESSKVDEYVIPDWAGTPDNPALFTCHARDDMEARLRRAGLGSTEILDLPASPVYDELPRLRERGVRPYAVAARATVV